MKTDKGFWDRLIFGAAKDFKNSISMFSMNIGTRKKMDNTDSIISRVMDSKVFRQVAAFCGKRNRSKDLTVQQIPQALPENSTKVQETVKLDEAKIPGPDLQEDLTIGEAAAKRAGQKDVQENHENREFLTDINPYEGSFGSISEFIENPDDPDQTLTTKSTTKAPLGSHYPEIFSFEGRDGEPCSALCLTDLMVARWNVIFRCESKIEGYINELNMIEHEQKRVTYFIEEISLRLQATILEDPTFDKSSELQIIDNAQKIGSEFRERKETIERKFRQAEEEMVFSRKYLFTNLKELFEENNLLEPTPIDSDDGSIASNPIERGQEPEVRRRTATSSEAAAYAVEEARDAAVEDMHYKERRLQDLRHKFDNWADYYEAENREYCKCIDNGQMAPARTTFDNVLLQEHQELTRGLTQAEHEFEDARRLARKFGTGDNDSDQESDFTDYVDDGYRESMEAAIIEHMDRDRIERWIEEDQDRPFHSTECDAWESRTVDLCDSVSVVAEGKERKRIDRWRSLCKLIEVDVARESDPNPPMD